MEKKTMDIMLTNREQVEGEVIAVVESDVVDSLLKLSFEREKLANRSQKLNVKKGKAIRSAKKRINQFANSRQVKYDETTQGIGIYQGETMYVGNLERIKSDPTLPPAEEDVVVGTLTKTEKRLYNDELKSYAFINKQISEYVNDLTNNEMQFVVFEKSILKDKTYDTKKYYLAISLVDGKVYLCKHSIIEEAEVLDTVEQISLEEQKELEIVGEENGRN